MDCLTKPCLHQRRGFVHIRTLAEIWTNLSDFTKFAFSPYYQIIRNGIRTYDTEITNNSPIVGEITDIKMISKLSEKTKLVY